jgi:hypothetical protein
MNEQSAHIQALPVIFIMMSFELKMLLRKAGRPQAKARGANDIRRCKNRRNIRISRAVNALGVKSTEFEIAAFVVADFAGV